MSVNKASKIFNVPRKILTERVGGRKSVIKIRLPLPQSVTGNQPLTTPTVQFQYVGQPQSLVQPHSSVQPLNSTQQVSVIPPSSVQPLNSTQQVSVIPSSSVQPLINSTQQAMRIPGPQTQGLPQTIMGPPHQVSSSGGPSSTPYRSRSPDPP
ncbi:uncharacterized protein LOC144625146 isoform X2 [Crassostrea virginica]